VDGTAGGSRIGIEGSHHPRVEKHWLIMMMINVMRGGCSEKKKETPLGHQD